MPIINGLKMACEPCIRGHRSTKCTHADERLMVPVKKPGRPLSACPHLHSQLCGCSSVTAAIPRKQKCHCGTSIPNGTPPAVQPRPVASTIPDIPSPTRVSFRVQKGPFSSRPGSRKPSFDLSSLERMDVGNINIIPFQAWNAQPAPTPTVNGGGPPAAFVEYSNGFSGPGYSPAALQPSQQSLYSDNPFQFDGSVYGLSSSSNNTGNLTNGSYQQLETLEESFVASGQPSGGGSCCGTVPILSNGSAETNSRPRLRQEPMNGCCSKVTPDQSSLGSTPAQSIPKTPGRNDSLKGLDVPFPGDLSVQSPVYPPYMSRATVYAYPPSYGSYQHPLQPSEWRKSFASNLYAQSEAQSQVSNDIINFPSASEDLASLDTFHTCSCGDGCQCIGCAAHPYNEPTQNYVRSAYNMINEPSPPGSSGLSNGHGNGITFSPTSDALASMQNGNGSSRVNGEATSPHPVNTPSDPGSGEEQSLSASDFFFVNYPFPTDGCGGDTNSCPCGDDCQCIGCTIHRLDDSIPKLAPEAISNDHEYEITSSTIHRLDDSIPKLPPEAINNGHEHEITSSNGAELIASNIPAVKSEESEGEAAAKVTAGDND